MAYETQDEYWAMMRRRAQTMMADAIRNGTHSVKSQRVCPECRQWCDGLYDAPADGSQGRCLACHVRHFYPHMTVEQFQAAVRRGEAR